MAKDKEAWIKIIYIHCIGQDCSMFQINGLRTIFCVMTQLVHFIVVLAYWQASEASETLLVVVQWKT